MAKTSSRHFEALYLKLVIIGEVKDRELTVCDIRDYVLIIRGSTFDLNEIIDLPDPPKPYFSFIYTKHGDISKKPDDINDVIDKLEEVYLFEITQNDPLFYSCRKIKDRGGIYTSMVGLIPGVDVEGMKRRREEDNENEDYRKRSFLLEKSGYKVVKYIRDICALLLPFARGDVSYARDDKSDDRDKHELRVYPYEYGLELILERFEKIKCNDKSPSQTDQ